MSTMTFHRRVGTALGAIGLVGGGLVAGPGLSGAVAVDSEPTSPTAALSATSAADSFYTYSGSTPLASIAPGTVLDTRTLSYNVLGLETRVQAVQLLFRTTDAQGRPSAGVTSVLKPTSGANGKAVSYQSFYDSLNPADGPSRAIAGNVTLGGVVNTAEALFIAPLLRKGYTVNVPDTQGQTANFAAGPEYGTTTLDSIRAASASGATGMSESTKVGLIGYSGGAIATNWAAVMAPSYAPDVNDRLVGYAEGGVLVNPIHNLEYVDGSLAWAGIAPMAIIGAARAYDLDLSPYLSENGKQLVERLENASIVNVLFQYPGLTWKSLVKPEYADPTSIEPFVKTVNKLNLGSQPTPTIPGFIGQGAAGVLEGTSGMKPGVGRGDGVMIAGDVRSLARQYCATGAPAVKYKQYNLNAHLSAALVWAPAAMDYLDDRFAGKTAPSDCGNIPAGNSLAPAQVTQPANVN